VPRPLNRRRISLHRHASRRHRATEDELAQGARTVPDAEADDAAEPGPSLPPVLHAGFHVRATGRVRADRYPSPACGSARGEAIETFTILTTASVVSARRYPSPPAQHCRAGRLRRVGSTGHAAGPVADADACVVRVRRTPRPLASLPPGEHDEANLLLPVNGQGTTARLSWGAMQRKGIISNSAHEADTMMRWTGIAQRRSDLVFSPESCGFSFSLWQSMREFWGGSVGSD